MGLTMNERRAVTAVMVARYRRASKKQKGRLLDELIALTGYNRWYAVGLLRGHATTPEGRGGRINKRPRQRLDRNPSGDQQSASLGVRSAAADPGAPAVCAEGY